jgi:hypothetical protein
MKNPSGQPDAGAKMEKKSTSQFDAAVRLASLALAHAAPRCQAQRKHGAGPCRGAAVKGRRTCRMHGGAAGSGAPRGRRNGNYKSGAYTKEAVAARRLLWKVLRSW